jgi:hypothetical protein
MKSQNDLGGMYCFKEFLGGLKTILNQKTKNWDILMYSYDLGQI